jgi:hypothetical protein
LLKLHMDSPSPSLQMKVEIEIGSVRHTIRVRGALEGARQSNLHPAREGNDQAWATCKHDSPESRFLSTGFFYSSRKIENMVSGVTSPLGLIVSGGPLVQSVSTFDSKNLCPYSHGTFCDGHNDLPHVF